eukprot:6200832-Prymnesium_polylepis.2
MNERQRIIDERHTSARLIQACARGRAVRHAPPVMESHAKSLVDAIVEIFQTKEEEPVPVVELPPSKSLEAGIDELFPPRAPPGSRGSRAERAGGKWRHSSTSSLGGDAASEGGDGDSGERRASGRGGSLDVFSSVAAAFGRLGNGGRARIDPHPMPQDRGGNMGKQGTDGSAAREPPDRSLSGKG